MDKLRVTVPVANLWRSKRSPRPIDNKMFGGDPKNWTQQMSDQETIQLCDDSLIDSQVLFNDEVQVEREEGTWTKVIVPNQPTGQDKRGYPGWIPSSSLSPAQTKQKGAKKVIVKVKTTTLYDGDHKPRLELSMGTQLQKVAEDDGQIKVATPLGIGYVDQSAVKIPANLVGTNDGETMVNIGKEFLGLRYLWAGISAYGFDCSGLVYSLHRLMGVILPRDADDQQKNGLPVKSDAIKPGDLVFFAYEHGTGQVHHVGMYIGSGQMLESRTPGKKVDIASLTEPKFAAEFAGYRRYWHEKPLPK